MFVCLFFFVLYSLPSHDITLAAIAVAAALVLIVAVVAGMVVAIFGGTIVKTLGAVVAAGHL